MSNLQKKFRSSFHGNLNKIFSAQKKNTIHPCSYMKKLEDDKICSRETLILKYSSLVKSIVNRLPVNNIPGIDKEDLISYGTIGLIEAVDRFDTSKNVTFETYASTRIRGAIYDELRTLDVLSRGSRKKVKSLSAAVLRLEAKLNRTPTDSEIVEEMQISLADLRAIRQEADLSVSSLDEKKEYSDEGSSLVESISSNEKSAQEKIEESELLQVLTRAIDCLPERERTVIGLYHYDKLTFKEIAEVMEFSESRASQLHTKAIALLREKMIRV